ncbi:hypothetical protein B0H13DRAFT_1978054 [Mycena leptocephala]|nr:hypothetical protein B0H13DRAFT_1978054 [Mycena leptocephala]
MVQTNGLAGHEHEFYGYVSQTDWVGGTSAYSSLEEAGSYWFNAMVPNGILANNSAINAKTSAFLSYVLSHQDSTGWLGPEVGTTKPRYLWGRYPFMFGAIQMTEFNPSLTTEVVTALYKFVNLANTMLRSNNTGVEAWTATRWEDFVMTLQCQALLIDTMERLKWTGVFSKQVFLENTPNPFNLPLTWHGVNMAEGLKALPATYRFTHNQSDLDTASQGWDLLFQYHGRPSGIYAADEYLAGLEAIRGTELCLVVETMFSGSFLYQVIGDPKFPDRVERIAYNALPGTLTGSTQYLQQQNQIFAGNMSKNPFPIDGPYSNVFGLEGWPSLSPSDAFVTTPDNLSLVHLYLGPFSTSVTLASGKPSTLYPFSDTVTTTITAKAAFTYYVRIPSWVVGGTIAINNAAAKSVAPVNGLQAVTLPHLSQLVSCQWIITTLGSRFSAETRPHGAIAVHRGPLHYAFDIPRTQKVLATNAQQPMAQDFQFNAAANWQYAIDPATLKFSSSPPASGTLPSPIFDSGLTPLKITATACLINWAIAGPTFAASPPTSPACTGANTTITLTPYGATKLRISEFPVLSKSL